MSDRVRKTELSGYFLQKLIAGSPLLISDFPLLDRLLTQVLILKTNLICN